MVSPTRSGIEGHFIGYVPSGVIKRIFQLGCAKNVRCRREVPDHRGAADFDLCTRKPAHRHRRESIIRTSSQRRGCSMVDLYRSLASIAASEQTTSSERLIIDNYVPNAMRRWSLAVRGFLFAEYRPSGVSQKRPLRVTSKPATLKG